jgi:hypothetical protein
MTTHPHNVVRPFDCEQQEKEEIVRQQVRDAASGDEVLLWFFHEKHFFWVGLVEAVALCLQGRASIQDPPVKRRGCRIGTAGRWQEGGKE